MAAIIMWLRGYHAGKTGVIPSHSNVPLPLSPALRGRPDGLFAFGGAAGGAGENARLRASWRLARKMPRPGERGKVTIWGNMTSTQRGLRNSDINPPHRPPPCDIFRASPRARPLRATPG